MFVLTAISSNAPETCDEQAHRDVLAALGPADEALIAEIIATDATAEELSQPGLGETATRR